MRLTGGCQCGAVRFAVDGDQGRSSICYCRMCQKAAAATGLALVGPGEQPVHWTRGAPSWFQSSSSALRGFCSKCGTPLAYKAPDGLALTVMSFDDPDAVAPTIQYGTEAKRPWCDDLAKLPGRETLDDVNNAPFLATLRNFQHPDRDTEEWPPEFWFTDDHH
ncbi:MAG: GFA family protein [Ahrensia sp.]